MAAFVLGKQKRHISAAISGRGVARLRKGEAWVQTLKFESKHFASRPSKIQAKKFSFVSQQSVRNHYVK
jgi:hypothetical protein